MILYDILSAGNSIHKAKDKRKHINPSKQPRESNIRPGAPQTERF
jgi:hypothetical protein